MFDAIILSDVHLGTSNCQAKSLCAFLEELVNQEISTAELILNGDVFDSIDFRRLNKNHWRVLSLLRKLSDRTNITWISGNHDGSAEIVSHLLGVTVKDEHVVSSGNRKILVLHGHIFDDFIEAHPFLTWMGDVIYFTLQWIDRTHRFAKWAKHGSKTFLRCARKVEDGAMEYARKRNCHAVCCGHTHYAMSNQTQAVHYHNSGCWTETPGTYLTVTNGQIRLHTFQHSSAEEHEDSLPAAAMV